jgi:hypothetical protein
LLKDADQTDLPRAVHAVHRGEAMVRAREAGLGSG